MQMTSITPRDARPGARYYFVTGSEAELEALKSAIRTSFRYNVDYDKIDGGLQVHVHKSETQVLADLVKSLSERAAPSTSAPARGKSRVLVHAGMTEDRAKAMAPGFDGFGKAFYISDEDTSVYGLPPGDGGRVKYAYYRHLPA